MRTGARAHALVHRGGESRVATIGDHTGPRTRAGLAERAVLGGIIYDHGLGNTVKGVQTGADYTLGVVRHDDSANCVDAGQLLTRLKYNRQYRSKPVRCCSRRMSRSPASTARRT